MRKKIISQLLFALPENSQLNFILGIKEDTISSNNILIFLKFSYNIEKIEKFKFKTFKLNNYFKSEKLKIKDCQNEVFDINNLLLEHSK